LAPSTGEYSARRASRGARPRRPGVALHAGPEGFEVEPAEPLRLLGDRPQALERLGLGEVEERSCHRRHRQTVDAADIGGIEPPRAVDDDAGELPCGWAPGHADVDRPAFACQILGLGRAEIAEDGGRPGGEQRREPSPACHQRLGARGEDAGMDRTQATAADPIADCSGSEADPQQLVAGDDPVLLACQLRQPVLARDRTWVAEVLLYDI
jgi:hypothetical protein